MKRETLWRAVGQIDPELVWDAAPGRGRSPGRAWKRWGALAACLCLAAGLFTLAPGEGRWAELAENFRPLCPSETLAVPRWETRTVPQRYGYLPFDALEYSGQGVRIPEDRLGELLGEGEALGWDEYAPEDRERRIAVQVRAVTKIDRQCAVAVQFQGEPGWYAFVQSAYRPETLGELIRALNLEEELTFGPAYCSGRDSSGAWVTLRYDGVEAGRVWQLLRSSPEAENVWDDLGQTPLRDLSLSVNVPLLGYENISVSVSADGWLMTNILDTGKQFFVGEENTGAFLDYVLTQCRKTELRPDGGPAVPE